MPVEKNGKYSGGQSADHRDIEQKKPKKHRIRNVFTIIFIIFIGLYCVGGYLAYDYVKDTMKDAPELNVNDLVSVESTRIYDYQDNLITEVGAYYRENIKYDDCPETLIDAFLSIEDSRFFQHNGVDIPRLLSSAVSTFSGNEVQGGSTFTMQLIKNTYFSIDDVNGGKERDATIEYKVQQIMLSLELEKQMSKQEIFELYVNKLNFGNRIRGVQKAAQYYFGKNVTQLNLPESAMLAGIINLPNLYNPYVYLDYATERRNEVLDMMYLHGYITDDERTLAKSVRVEDELVGEDKFNADIDNAHSEYIDAVLSEAEEMTGKDPVTNGMEIHTAMIPGIQSAIESMEADDSIIPWSDDLMQTAIVSLDNRTGAIVGIGGGRNYTGGARLLNRATSQPRQPGSSIKPVLDYPLGFEYLGYSTDEILQDRPLSLPGESRIIYDAMTEEFQGDIRIKDALFNSLNPPAVDTLMRVAAVIGEDSIVDYLKSMGISAAENNDFNLQWAIGGSTCELTVKEMAGAHAAMINLGVYNEPHTITKLVMEDGTTYLPENQNVRVLSSGSAYLVDELTRYNVDHSREAFNFYRSVIKDYPVYAKTGTSDYGDDGLAYGIPSGSSKDKWMVVSTANYTNAVWVGYDEPVAGAGTYFTLAKINMNHDGRINKVLIDTEEAYSDDTLSTGVQRPSDVVDVSYIDGTYPHVAAENETGGYSYNGTVIQSMESAAGLANRPLVQADDYTAEVPVLEYFDANVSTSGMLYVNWNPPSGCSGTRDISLKNEYNNITMYGTCLASVPSQYRSSSGEIFYADIYQEDSLLGTISSEDSYYSGYPYDLDGNITVCGYYSNGYETSNSLCRSFELNKASEELSDNSQ